MKRLDWKNGRPDEEIRDIYYVYHDLLCSHLDHKRAIKETIEKTQYDENSVRLAVYDYCDDRLDK